MKKVLFGFAIALLLGGLTAFAVAWFGLFNPAASAPVSRLEERLAPWVRDRAIRKRAPRGKNPLQGRAEAVARGLLSYRQSCLICHEAPGVDLSFTGIGVGLNPPAPNLTLDAQDRPDGELAWIIGEGIRMTGMPAFKEAYTPEQIQELVAFLRHLPDITDEERRQLKQGVKVPSF